MRTSMTVLYYFTAPQISTSDVKNTLQRILESMVVIFCTINKRKDLLNTTNNRSTEFSHIY